MTLRRIESNTRSALYFFEMDILAEYTQFVNSLEMAGIEYATCDGLAMAVHGYVRATKDLDFLIRQEDLDAAFTLAKSLGFDIEGLPREFDGGSFLLRRLSKIDQETKSLITIDFILLTDNLRDVWEDREHLTWGSGSAWVVSRQGLIKMKAAAGRDQDIVDIRRLEEADDEN